MDIHENALKNAVFVMIDYYILNFEPGNPFIQVPNQKKSLRSTHGFELRSKLWKI